MSSVPTLTLCASASVSSACASDDVPGVVELALGHRQRERRSAGDGVGELRGGGVELVDGHHAVDQAEVERLGTVAPSAR